MNPSQSSSTPPEHVVSVGAAGVHIGPVAGAPASTATSPMRLCAPHPAPRRMASIGSPRSSARDRAGVFISMPWVSPPGKKLRPPPGAGPREEAGHLGGVLPAGKSPLVGAEVGARAIVTPQVPQADRPAAEGALGVGRRRRLGRRQQPIEVFDRLRVTAGAGPQLGAGEELLGPEATREVAPRIEEAQ